MGDTLYYVWLSLVQRLPADHKLFAAERFGGPKALFEASSKDIQELFCAHSFLTAGAGLKKLLRKDLGLAERCLAQAQRTGVHIITAADEEYPESLKNIKDPPIALFAKGDKGILRSRRVAVVGTRRASPYGRWAAAEIGKRLGGTGISVVSGMAEGVDAAAHRGCLQAGGKTAAVFGTGVDVCFPSSNIDLYEEIGEKGLILSEYPFAQPGYPWNFPERNRIISGLCESCIVVEGAVRSGSLITAGLAAEAGREVFAVPGNINQPGSSGTNLLISEGAGLICSMDGLLETLGIESVGAGARTALSEEEMSLLGFIRECGSSSKIYIEENCGLGYARASAILVSLELKGAVSVQQNSVHICS